MAATDPFIGQRIEKCQVLRTLSRGGYGTTYLAFDEELHTQRVIKVSHEPLGDDPGGARQLKAFIEEGMILSRLKHPQIVTLRAQGEHQKRRYMVLDFVEGLSLREMFERLRRLKDHTGQAWHQLLDPATATAIIASTLEPLAYAHEAKMRLPGREVNGVAHRDIAPGNLILGTQGDEAGKMVLIDFGTAKTDLADMVTLNQSLIGTLPYMSKPRLQRAQTVEQAASQHSFWSEYLETRNDVHALGVLYAQLLTGRLPFRGESAPEILVNILDEANYKRLYEDIAQTFAPALSFIQHMVVWYDVNRPLGEQSAQYADAVALRAPFAEFFRQSFPGAASTDLLLDLNQRLRDAGLFNQTTAVVTRRGQPAAPSANGRGPDSQTAGGSPLSSVYIDRGENRADPSYASPTRTENQVAEAPPYYDPNQPKTLKFEFTPPPPVRRWPWIFAALAMIGLSIGIAFLLRPQKTERSGSLFASLESLEGSSPEASMKGKSSNASPSSLSGSSTAQTETAQVEKKRSHKAKNTTSPHSRSNPTLSENLSSPSHSGAALASEPPAAQTLPPLTRESFLVLQNRIKVKDSTVAGTLQARLAKEPQSADLRYLQARYLLDTEPPSPAQRQILAQLKQQSPQFLDTRLFQENVAYWIWQLNFRLFQAQPDEENRIALIQSGHSYLAAYGENSAFSSKAAVVKNSLP